MEYPIVIDEPVPFEGTDEESYANFLTHSFIGDDDGARCAMCDCKVWHKAASYRCGDTPPRQLRERHEDGTVTIKRLL